MSDQRKPMTQMLHGSTLGSHKAVKFLISTAICAALLCLSAITLTETVIALILATPVLVISSPITTIPVGALIALITVVFLLSGCCCVAALVALVWICKYVARKHPLADLIEYARMKIASRASDMKEMAKEYGQYAELKAEESTHGLE